VKIHQITTFKSDLTNVLNKQHRFLDPLDTQAGLDDTRGASAVGGARADARQNDGVEGGVDKPVPARDE
jgi:hypothetical protein